MIAAQVASIRAYTERLTGEVVPNKNVTASTNWLFLAGS
jgi:hypothetical protein